MVGFSSGYLSLGHFIIRLLPTLLPTAQFTRPPALFVRKLVSATAWRGVCGQILVLLFVDRLGLDPGCLAIHFHSFCGLILWSMAPTTVVVSAVYGPYNSGSGCGLWLLQRR